MRAEMVVLVPYMTHIEHECEQALRRLEAEGVRVVRRGGCSGIDVARNDMISEALHDGAESILFVDSDIGFDPQDALRLLERPEPVISGVYAKKGMREMASVFAEGTKEVLFGVDAKEAYPLRYAATGFLRIRASVLRRMITELKLPLCAAACGRSSSPWPCPRMGTSSTTWARTGRSAIASARSASRPWPTRPSACGTGAATATPGKRRAARRRGMRRIAIACSERAAHGQSSLDHERERYLFRCAVRVENVNIHNAFASTCRTQEDLVLQRAPGKACGGMFMES